jgi:hypothetical protein
VPSVPNFELWLLLHFRDMFEFMHRDQVYAELRRADHYPTYTKSSTTVYTDTKDRIPVASDRAAALREQHSPHEGDQPYTGVDLLTGELLKIAGRLQ